MNWALKQAFIESGRKQIVFASELGIRNDRLSQIVNGHVEPTKDEKKAIAKALRKSVADLFLQETA